MLTKEKTINWFQGLQDEICTQLEAADGKGQFREDAWRRPEGGGGRTRILEGRHIAKGGVNFSAVHGPMPEKISRALGISTGDFLATGVSIVLHPANPMVPVIHMNVRYFEVQPAGNPEGEPIWWFGGGIDLTPHYIDTEDARFFHQQLKKVCDAHHPDYYAHFKQWADDYFYLKHRRETRGVGGIFFDRLNEEGGFSKAARFAFVQEVGRAFSPLYIHFLEKHREASYGERELAWQGLRRGRYVEFNLVWDKGTKFGLDTEGRTESILMSLPPVANWAYDYHPEEGTPEARTLSLLRKGIDWVNYTES
ncbi:MAG: oxygen-dependent coproporphyrinogen oxidase [Lewinellaceae bacterium]|nr:oxygen-dependent coproporphyrinogen oxidase [Phaeodactylibacter sp.]MCB9349176.1 oxygen-dependent coproporphyrinogen oxidase [Lewinellaceae bacterium]